MIRIKPEKENNKGTVKAGYRKLIINDTEQN